MLEELRARRSAGLLSMQEAKKAYSRQLELVRLKERQLEAAGIERDGVYNALVSSEKRIGELKGKRMAMEEEESAFREEILDDYLRQRGLLRETLMSKTREEGQTKLGE